MAHCRPSYAGDCALANRVQVEITESADGVLELRAALQALVRDRRWLDAGGA